MRVMGSWARHRRGTLVGLALALVFVACSGGDGSDGAPPVGAVAIPSTTLPEVALPRYREDGLRLTTSPEQPLAIYNVYPTGAQPELITDVVELWPEDLLPYLAIQIIISGVDELPEAERVAALDAMLDAADTARVPVIVQTLTFSGPKGPSMAAIDAALEAHPSFVGIGVAELSAAYDASIGGLLPGQRDQLAERIEQAARHDAVLLWADMGYLGPQVFVDAGADERLYALMREHADSIIVQVKQNGLGRRFGTQSAAFGLFASGLAGAWGINSEDWLWWEASLERLFGAQVPGGLTAAGMVRSDHPTRARLSYPEALFGTEMLVAAASGGTVFSIEAPWRGTIDPDGTGELSPAGTEVVFPVLRRLIGARLIPGRDEVLARTPLAFQPMTRDDPELATDLAFTGIYGPEGCSDEDRLVCAQRQWLPSTGRYGIIPTLPVLAGDEITRLFTTVVGPPGGDDEARRALVEQAGYPAGAAGDAWARPAAGADTWFVANPNENADVRATFELPALGDRGVVVGGELAPHTFVVLDGREGLSMLIDNYRTDSDRLWDEDISEADLGELPQDEVGDAAPDTTTLTVAVGDGASRPGVEVEGAEGEVDETWSSETGTLTISFRHRGPVEIAIG